MKSPALALALLACSMVAPALAAPAAETVLLNGKIVTVDDQFRIASAVAISGDRIVAVGSDADIRARITPETEVIDLAGRTVIPGLIDAHSHMVRASELWHYEVRFDGVTSRKAALDLLRAKARTLKPGDWILNFGGWGELQFRDDPRGFTLAELDAIAPDNPVFLDVSYDHRYVNSRFLALAGIPVVNTDAGNGAKASAATSPFAEARGFTEAMIVRDGEGRATGKIIGGAAGYGAAVPLFPKLSEAEKQAGLREIIDAALSVGLTTIYDGGGSGSYAGAYDRARTLAEQGALDMRIFHTRFVNARSPAEAREAAAEIAARRPFTGGKYMELIGIGESVYPPVHDSFAGPAHDTPENREGLKVILEAAARGGWNIQQHMVNPQTMAMTLDAMDELSKTYSLAPLRWEVIHAELVDAPTLARLRDYNMSVSFRTQYTIGKLRYDETVALPGDEARPVPPFRLAQDSGIPWTFGSEAPRINVLNPMMSLAFAVTGKRFHDRVKVLSETVTREEALIAHTRNGAWQVFRENSLGRIAPGFLADMVVLDRDYLGVPEDELFDVAPVMTLVGGKVVYRAGP